MTPEQLARQKIDAQLAACGWAVQDYKALDLPAGRGIALCEVPLKTGRCDYLLVVDQFSGEVEQWLSVVKELETAVSANLQRADRLRQSILQKAFTGEL